MRRSLVIPPAESHDLQLTPPVTELSSFISNLKRHIILIDVNGVNPVEPELAVRDKSLPWGRDCPRPGE